MKLQQDESGNALELKSIFLSHRPIIPRCCSPHKSLYLWGRRGLWSPHQSEQLNVTKRGQAGTVQDGWCGLTGMCSTLGICSGGGGILQDALLDPKVGPGGQTYRMCVCIYIFIGRVWWCLLLPAALQSSQIMLHLMPGLYFTKERALST